VGALVKLTTKQVILVRMAAKFSRVLQLDQQDSRQPVLQMMSAMQLLIAVALDSLGLLLWVSLSRFLQDSWVMCQHHVMAVSIAAAGTALKVW
jgi:hypothetical protein